MSDFYAISSRAEEKNNIKRYFGEFNKFIVNSNVETLMTLKFEFPNGFGCWVRCSDNTSIPELWHVRIYKDNEICEINPDSLGKENYAAIKVGCNRKTQITAFSSAAVKDILNAVKNFNR